MSQFYEPDDWSNDSQFDEPLALDPDRMPEDDICTACDGEGMDNGHLCKPCQGTGRRAN